MNDTTAPHIVEPHRPTAERSPCDLLRLVVSAVALVVAILLDVLFGNALTAFAADLLRGLDALPAWLVEGFAAVVRITAAVVLVVALGRAVVHGRWRYLLVLGLAALLGVTLFWLLSLLDLPKDATVVSGIILPGFPTAYGLVAVTGMLTAAAPWTSRGHRQLAWALIVGLAIVRFLSTPLSFETLLAVLTGWLAGSGALLVLGGPLRRPTAHAVADGLAKVGLPLHELVPASVDARGSSPFLGTSADGQRLFVKSLGDDERSADLLFRLWRRASRRKFGDEPSFSTLRRAVEHEALVSLSASIVGIRTPRFVALAKAEPNGFVLVYEAVAGRSLDGLAPEQMTDELLAQVWDKVTELRSHGIAHRDLRLANVFRSDDGEIWLIDFGFSELAADPLLLTTDLAELMASTATKVGASRAFSAAATAVGSDALRSTLPRLNLMYLSGATRTALKQQPEVLAELRRLVEQGA